MHASVVLCLEDTAASSETFRPYRLLLATAAIAARTIFALASTFGTRTVLLKHFQTTKPGRTREDPLRLPTPFSTPMMWGSFIPPGAPRIYYVGSARFEGGLACIEPQDL